MSGRLVARFVWPWIDSPRDFVVSEKDRQAMAQAFVFKSILLRNPDNVVSKHFKHLMAQTASKDLVSKMNTVFANQRHFLRVTFSS